MLRNGPEMSARFRCAPLIGGGHAPVADAVGAYIRPGALTGPVSGTVLPCASALLLRVFRRKSARDLVSCAPRVGGRHAKPRTAMKSTAERSPSCVVPVSTARDSCQKIPQIHRRSPPDQDVEFPSQDIDALAMKPTTALPSSPAADAPRLLARLPVVLKVTGLGRSTIYRWIADGSFPPPVRLGPRAVAWRWSDLDRWTSSRDTARH
jgi:prophage regulatory protein